MWLIPSPSNATSLWKACILQILYDTFIYSTLHILHTGTNVPFELHWVWFSEGSAVVLIERGEYILELEHRSFSHRLVEGYLVIQEVNIRKNRGLKKTNPQCTCTTTVLWCSDNLFKDESCAYVFQDLHDSCSTFMTWIIINEKYFDSEERITIREYNSLENKHFCSLTESPLLLRKRVWRVVLRCGGIWFCS